MNDENILFGLVDYENAVVAVSSLKDNINKHVKKPVLFTSNIFADADRLNLISDLVPGGINDQQQITNPITTHNFDNCEWMEDQRPIVAMVHYLKTCGMPSYVYMVDDQCLCCRFDNIRVGTLPHLEIYAVTVINRSFNDGEVANKFCISLISIDHNEKCAMWCNLTNLTIYNPLHQKCTLLRYDGSWCWYGYVPRADEGMWTLVPCIDLMLFGFDMVTKLPNQIADELKEAVIKSASTDNDLLLQLANMVVNATSGDVPKDKYLARLLQLIKGRLCTNEQDPSDSHYLIRSGMASLNLFSLYIKPMAEELPF